MPLTLDHQHLLPIPFLREFFYTVPPTFFQRIIHPLSVFHNHQDAATKLLHNWEDVIVLILPAVIEWLRFTKHFQDLPQVREYLFLNHPC